MTLLHPAKPPARASAKPAIGASPVGLSRWRRWAPSGILSVLSLAGAVTASAPASACGGFFCSQSLPVNQAAERIVFADNGDGTVTAVIQILYEGPSENFSWLLPISSVPDEGDIAVSSDLAFQRLQQATNPRYNLNTVVEGSCKVRGGNGVDLVNDSAPAVQSSSAGSADFDSSGPGVTVAASGVVGQFEWTALELDSSLEDPADVAVQWLEDNGYDVSPGSEELIAPYLLEGRYLLALRLTKGSDTGSIRPIVLTYDADLPDIPLQLTAVAATEDMGVMTWVAAEERAVPFNYNALELNEARINWFNAGSTYDQVVTEAANEAEGHGFVTEFAGSSSGLGQAVWPDFEEERWTELLSLAGQRSLAGQFELFSRAYDTYDGFWDAVRATVSTLQDVSFEAFQDCPDCYDVQFDPEEFPQALERSVIEPMRLMQRLLDGQPYITRMYSTLSAADMTVDPVFNYNSELGDVSNLHQATRIIECNPSIYESQANYRIELPQGSVVRGRAGNFGTWPGAVDKQAANWRILRMSTSGQGAVLEDNSGQILDDLQQFNDTVPSTRKSSGWCSVSLPGGGGSQSAPMWAGLLALIGYAGLKRRRR